MIIDYDSRPCDSIYYSAARLYSMIRGKKMDIDDIFSTFEKRISANIMQFYYSMDWLFLLGKVELSKDGMVLCD